MVLVDVVPEDDIVAEHRWCIEARDKLVMIRTLR